MEAAIGAAAAAVEAVAKDNEADEESEIEVESEPEPESGSNCCWLSFVVFQILCMIFLILSLLSINNPQLPSCQHRLQSKLEQGNGRLCSTSYCLLQLFLVFCSDAFVEMNTLNSWSIYTK
jgi:hypothetical protein